MRRYVAIQLVTKPGFCPNRIVLKDGSSHCWNTLGMKECSSWNEFPDFCPLEDMDKEPDNEEG